MLNEVLDIDGNMWRIMPYDMCLGDPRTPVAFGRTIKEVIDKYPGQLREGTTGNLPLGAAPSKQDGYPGLVCTETNIAFIGYKHADKLMLVEYSNGRKYRYFDVGLDVWHALLIADSKGAELNRLVKGHYKYEPVNGD
jgi:hypothetical protein